MANYLIIYSDEALQDLREIFEYIAGELREPAIAAAQINRIREQVRSLGHFPARNKKVAWEPWRSMGMRQMPVDNFIAFYTIDDTQPAVQIVRIFYGKRDIESYIRQPSG